MRWVVVFSDDVVEKWEIGEALAVIWRTGERAGWWCFREEGATQSKSAFQRKRLFLCLC